MANPRKTPAPEPVVPVAGFDDQPQRNPYYDRVAAGYRTARHITVFFLVLVLVAGLVTGSGSITYSNFIYLLRDFDTILSATGGETVPSIRYGTADDRQYLVFRDGLTLVGQSGIEVYNTSGRRTLDETPGFSDPRAAASSQYLLVYDRGGNSYALYNSLAKIYSAELDFPISGGAISDTGMYAVVTKTREYTSAVLLYNKNNKLKNRYLKDQYVLDVAISDDGQRIAMVSVQSADGAYLAEFQLCQPGKDSAIATLSLPGVFPLSVRFFDDNSWAVLCADAIYFYGADGEARGAIAFVDEAPSRFAVEGDRAALVFPANVVGTESRVVVYSSAGTVQLDCTLTGKAQELTMSDGYIYLLTERSLWQLDAAGTACGLDVDGGGKALLPVEDGVLLCTGSTAYRYAADRFAQAAQSQEEESD